jgi:prepilin-type N-terminal cleavage/methylation domain-containing protein
MRCLARQSPGRGVTLIELLVALVIMMLIAGGVSRILVRSWLSEEVTNDQNVAERAAQQAVDVVVDRLRAGAVVAAGDAGQVTVAYENGDTVSFFVQGHALRRTSYLHDTGQTTTETVVPDFLTGLSFQYRQRDGAGWKQADAAAVADWVVVSASATSGRCLATEISVVKLRNKG